MSGHSHHWAAAPTAPTPSLLAGQTESLCWWAAIGEPPAMLLHTQGVATIALESPYYGKRRPPWQEGSKLCRVSDLLTLGRATIEESLYLLTWAKRAGFDRLGALGTQALHRVN